MTERTITAENSRPRQVTPPWPSQPRTTVLVQFPDNRIFEAPIGTLLETFIRTAYNEDPVPIVAGLINCKLYEDRAKRRNDPHRLAEALNNAKR